MKSPIPYLFCLMLLLGCKDTEELTFDTVIYENESCEGCPKVAISLPQALEKTRVSSTIANALKEEVIFLLTFDDKEAKNIEEAIQSFKSGYSELKRKYPDESAKWEANITGDVSYEDGQLLTIQLKSYIYTGGAHGYSATRFLNFDKQKGKELENWELFEKNEDFEQFAEYKFRQKENIPQKSPINSTGFMFEQDKFHLPENIGFTTEGLELLYNQYEVASYADGPIKLILPYEEVEKYLVKKKKS